MITILEETQDEILEHKKFTFVCEVSVASKSIDFLQLRLGGLKATQKKIIFKEPLSSWLNIDVSAFFILISYLTAPKSESIAAL